MKTACGGQSIKHDHGAELRHLVVWRKQEKDGQSVWRARWERPVAIGADDQRIDSATLRSFFLDPREWKADVGSASAIHVHRRGRANLRIDFLPRRESCDRLNCGVKLDHDKFTRFSSPQRIHLSQDRSDFDSPHRSRSIDRDHDALRAS